MTMPNEPYRVERIAQFVLRQTHDDLKDSAKDRLKRSILDTVGCAIGALGSSPVKQIRNVVDQLGSTGTCTVIGGGRASLDRAALVNGCLVRYLDFMDNFAAPGEVCHPSDNLAAILAAAEFSGASGREFLLAFAIAYQVQCRLLASLPTMRAGMNYTTPLAFSVAAGAAKLLGLDAARTAHALALAGVGSVSLAVIQAEPVSQWKGLASGEAGSRALHNTLLAGAGITGTLGVFEGPFGLQRLAGAESNVDWSNETLDIAEKVSIKLHNAEFQSQTAVQAAVDLHHSGLNPDEIVAIEVAASQGAYDVLGGGSYGPKDECRNKEQADHNLKYLVAVALLDGEVWPEQFASDRILRADVQNLLKKVTVVPDREFTSLIPGKMRAAVTVHLSSGERLHRAHDDYEGFHTRPMSWDTVTVKFSRLTKPFLEDALRDDLVHAVREIETIRVQELTGLLSRISPISPLSPRSA